MSKIDDYKKHMESGAELKQAAIDELKEKRKDLQRDIATLDAEIEAITGRPMAIAVGTIKKRVDGDALKAAVLAVVTEAGKTGLHFPAIAGHVRITSLYDAVGQSVSKPSVKKKLDELKQEKKIKTEGELKKMLYIVK